VDLIQKLHDQSAEGKVAPLLERLITDIDYLSLWREEADEVDVDRAANVHELISAARQYDALGEDSETQRDWRLQQQSGLDTDNEANDPEVGDSKTSKTSETSESETDVTSGSQQDQSDATSGFMTDNERTSLQGFLELATLANEADSIDQSKGSVTLMTLHASKGLEFPSVYIIGIESGLIPHERAVREGDLSSFEEERRLLFVGITRAMHQLTLTQTSERTFRGMRRATISSPFISELHGAIARETSVLTPPPVTEAMLDQRLEQARRRFEAAQKFGGRKLLMTAAELAAQQTLPNATTTDDSPASFAFRKGMQVRHPRYGRGLIIELSGGSHRATVTVEFETDGQTHTFVASRCPLQPIGLP